ncbi:MAG TPA: ornithine carbamoyltransferase [Candidatus Competibacteraceae bacterium]|nr:ornithine carbamoyltransferase [Candidatus Competibacteraceae bacterium]MCP5132810.1 ornithine carbamoyltransferase [Gammaproteobacteria bacterium]HPF57560.1 ornithine carbamoyltransferase [Candidatus Competibacteraceae bacterium]HRY16919.1 ornithine carbamoyltransferase [Candidatus Competibacteraceae bacterium]
MKTRHFLSLFDLTPAELQQILRRANELKILRQRGEYYAPFPGKVLGMIFEKASTRTRVSFEAGIAQLGGSAIFLSPRDTQLGRGEPVEDTARVLSGMVDLMMIRTFAHASIERFAEYSTVPVINGLTDYNHPCQLLADLQTFIEQRGGIQGRTVAWIGDGNNMCNSYLSAACQCDFQLRIAVPPGYEPDAELLQRAAGRVVLLRDPLLAARDADLVTTDVWSSMGKEEQQQRRQRDFSPYQVTAEIMAQAKPDALFLHCLPAHRGEEVSAEVIDGPQSRVWDQAENRLHVQKALMEFLLLGGNTPA